MNLLHRAQRLTEDVRHGRRLGEKSTAILMELIEAMAARIDYLQAEVTRLRKEKEKSN